MPYTPKERRPSVNQEFGNICLENKGDLTAAIYALQLRFINEHDINYQNISDAIAAGNDANDEVKRIIRDTYEIECIASNGDFKLAENIIDKIGKKFAN